MRVFLDVGSNRWQTISSILEPMHGFGRICCRYGFDRIYGFEPVPELHRMVSEKYRDRRFTFYAVGLWKESLRKTDLHRLGAAARERVTEYALPHALAAWESVVGLTC